MTSTPPPPANCQRCGASLGAGAVCPRCGTSVPVHRPWSGPTLATPPGAPAAIERPEAAEAQLAALRRATLGDYEVLGEVGRGGMATVYLAHDLSLDRKVAIKVLAPALLLMGEGMVERFKREARTAAALSHPHIIPIYAVKESDQVLYFVMKHVKGRSLDHIIRDTGPLPIPMTQAILAQVSDALGYAHRHGVIHRDIKSANIMLDEEGWAVVTDFGIAKVTQAQGLTMTGVTVGTPTYMSPEQCATEEVTGASDQYSLGVVAYEMLTATLPFQDDSIMSIMYAHFNQPPRPVTELRPDCPPNLAAAVMRMLEKDPAQRWPSMDDVVAVCGRPSLRRDDPIRREMISLAQGADTTYVGPRTPSSPIALSRSRTRPTKPRRRWWWPAGAAATTVLALGLWWASPWSPRARRVAQPPPAPRDSATVTATRPESSVVLAPPVPTPQPPVRPAPVSTSRRVADSLTHRVAQRDDSMLASLRTNALNAQQRAALAGATPTDLSAGHAALASAESLAAARRVSEALMQFVSAAALWGDAERAARARSVRDSEARRVAETPPPAPAPAPAPVPVPPAASDPRVDIQQQIADYAAALESRDVEQVRRAYPGLTAAQQRSWQTFFGSVHNLKASLNLASLNVTGGSADATVTGVYDYDNASTGRPEHRPVTFHVTLVRDANGGWRISAIR
jgi:serine/threonine protein kinase/ketosteroid isomerase-like protein